MINISIFEGGRIKKIKICLSPRKRREEEFYRKMRALYPIVDYHYKDKKEDVDSYKYYDEFD